MNIFEQKDYKEIVKHYLLTKEGQIRGAYRKLSENLGVHPTLVSQILGGERHFSEEQLFQVCEYLQIGSVEKKFLLVLLQIERAGSHSLKRHYTEMRDNLRAESLQLSKRIRTHKTLQENEKAVFYSCWIYSAVQILTAIDKHVDLKYISEHFKINLSRAREVCDFLIKYNLIVEKNGRFIPGTTSTHLDKKSPHIIKHHTNWRLKAIAAAETLSDRELMYSANFSISEKDFDSFREELVGVINKFLSVVEKSPAENVAQFNLDYFYL